MATRKKATNKKAAPKKKAAAKKEPSSKVVRLKKKEAERQVNIKVLPGGYNGFTFPMLKTTCLCGKDVMVPAPTPFSNSEAIYPGGVADMFCLSCKRKFKVGYKFATKVEVTLKHIEVTEIVEDEEGKKK